MKLNKQITMISSIAVIIISSILIFTFNAIQAKNDNAYSNLQKQLHSEKKSLALKKESVRKKAVKQVISGNSSAKDAVAQHKALSDTAIANNKFFAAFTTYDSGADYGKRADLVKSIANDDVLNNSKLFSSSKDVSGNDYIDTLKLHSKFGWSKTTSTFNNEKLIISLVEVDFSAWKDDQASGESRVLYKTTYDPAVGKLTSVEKLMTLSQAAEN